MIHIISRDYFSSLYEMLRCGFFVSMSQFVSNEEAFFGFRGSSQEAASDHVPPGSFPYPVWTCSYCRGLKRCPVGDWPGGLTQINETE